MKIYQLLPTLAFGDAVSNDALALEKVIREMGYKTEIFAESIDARLPKGSAKFVEKLPRLNEKDIILYHLSTGTKLNYRLAQITILRHRSFLKNTVSRRRSCARTD